LPLAHFLSTFLLKEQMMISVKKNLVVKQIQTRAIVQTNCSTFPAKSPVLQRQHLKVVSVSVAVVIA